MSKQFKFTDEQRQTVDVYVQDHLLKGVNPIDVAFEARRLLDAFAFVFTQTPKLYVEMRLASLQDHAAASAEHSNLRRVLHNVLARLPLACRNNPEQTLIVLAGVFSRDPLRLAHVDQYNTVTMRTGSHVSVHPHIQAFAPVAGKDAVGLIFPDGTILRPQVVLELYDPVTEEYRDLEEEELEALNVFVYDDGEDETKVTINDEK